MCTSLWKEPEIGRHDDEARFGDYKEEVADMSMLLAQRTVDILSAMYLHRLVGRNGNHYGRLRTENFISQYTY